MRTTFRKTSALVLGLAVVAALGGLTPSQAADATPKLQAGAASVLNQDATTGGAVVVSNISRKAHDNTNLTSVTLSVTFTPLPSGAPTTLAPITYNPNPAPPLPPTTMSIALAPLLADTDYAVQVVETGDTATATNIALSSASTSFSVRAPANLTMSVTPDTVLPNGNPLFGGGDVIINGTLTDAAGKAIIGAKIHVVVQGGIFGTTIQFDKPTGGDGSWSAHLAGGDTFWPGSYTVDASTLQSYSLTPVTNIRTNTFLNADQGTFAVIADI